MAYIPFRPVSWGTGNGSPQMTRQAEDDAETFKLGVPVYLDSDGFLQEISATWGSSEICYGVSAEPAHNLTTANTAQDLNEGSAPGQASGVTTPVGAWPRDGKLGVYKANGETTFKGSLKSGQTFAANTVGTTRYAIQKDATSGFWYIDTTDSGTSAKHAALIRQADPNDTSMVFFQFHTSTRYWN